MNQKKRATLYDVAHAAGVSHQTVSRVIHQHPNVSQKTRRKVQKAIEELEFIPNKAAQILTSQRSYMLEMITTTMYGSAAPMLAALVDTARQVGYHVTIQVIDSDELSDILQTASARLVDGTIIHVPNSNIQFQIPTAPPLVKMAGEPQHTISSVYIDQRLGTQLAVRHLIELGHRQIAHLRGVPTIYDAIVRHEVWQQTLHEAGLSTTLISEQLLTYQGGYTGMLHLLDSGESFTAVFAANDLMAIGAIRALQDRGLSVPADVSVVGFDDNPGADFACPRLTTVRQNLYELGQLAAETLLEKVEKPAAPVHQRVLIPEFILRESTRPLS